MPPKKKGKGKGKKGGDDGAEEGGKLTPRGERDQYKAECTSLQMQLAERTEDASRAMASKRQLEGKVDEINKSLDDKEEATQYITQAMTRQYEAMQEQLVDKITQLEMTVQDLQDKLEESELELERKMREKEAVISSKNEEIANMKNKMEDMAQEFGGMLKETLDKMRERIELSNSGGFDADSGVPIQRQMEEFNWSAQAEAKS